MRLPARGRGLAAAIIAALAWSTHVAGAQAATAPTAPPQVGAAGIAARPDGQGYWLAATYGDVLPFGSTGAYGAPTGTALNSPLVGIAATPSGSGYWLAAGDGGVFSYGDAGFFGSLGATRLNEPVVGMAATPDGGGYWLVASDGGIFAFGDAAFHGSTGAMHLNAPVVGMAATPSGRGYWLVASDGGIFTFGDAAFHGSTGAMSLNAPIAGMAATADGGGYWLVASDGGIFAFGDAAFHGSTGNLHLVQPVVGMAATPGGGGYWLIARDGGVFTFGDAGFMGSGSGRIRYGNDVASNPLCGVPANAVTGGKVIVISLRCQTLSAYFDGMPVLTTYITTGRPALPTPPGQYSVLRKVSPWLMTSDWPTWSPYWYPPSWVQYTLWFRSDGFAIHDAPWRAVYGPGTQANGSHGCVNVPMPIMRTLYSWAAVGTPVRVY